MLFNGFVISIEKPSGKYVVVTNHSQWWQGLEQDITARVSPSSYSVSVCVGVSGLLLGFTHVQATLKLENPFSQPSHHFVGR
ncbi:endo-1,4-beta-xylanase A-like protein [Corchorus olitorius]|uniref:Endo-1,4-beta-xylanase A-like protein n=1 Tax=Corchorus olitorius TaxID=93759 RepID=A0A1R3FV60_9ROSI|nr:endo-1,4-beta-xylanase A-like protein [Corchorus olitorius]